MSLEHRVKMIVPGDEPIQIQGSPHLKRLDSYGEVTIYGDRPTSLEEQLRRVEDTEIIINTRGTVKWTGHSLESLPKLKMITTCSIGTDMIDLDAASRLGIVVSNQPGRTAPIVAEHIIGLMFAVAKRMAFQTSELKSGRWTRLDNIFLNGKTLGLIGTGNVGSEVSRLGNALGMKVIAWTMHPSVKRAADLGVNFVQLDDLLKSSDVVSIQVNLTEDTRGMIGEREFRLMKKGSIFINGGRGNLIDTGSLIRFLNCGHLAGAGLDVFDQEPLPADHPILCCEQIVMTPHIADQTPEGMELLNEGAVSNVIAFLQGNPQNVVT